MVRSLERIFKRVSFKQILTVLALLFWIGFHYAGILYGTYNIPLHQSYVGDEQAPVNGALHILNERSLLAVHNLRTLYYGPVFAVIATPAVAGDFVWKYLTDQVHTGEAYKHSILWDWGGIIRNIRTLSVVASLIGLIALYYLALTKFFNPTQNHFLPYLTVSLVALNFYYFEYSHFFKHWIYIIVIFILQLLVIAKICDEPLKQVRKKWWIANSLLVAVSFGISYVSLFFQLIWISFLIKWVQDKSILYKEWFLSMTASFIMMAIVFMWHPYALLRIFQGGATIPFGEEMHGFGYFGKLIVLNHLGLVFALFASILYFASKKVESTFRYSYALSIIWGLSFVGFFHYVLFSIQPGLNREGRYMLPTILCFLLVCAYVFGIYFTEKSKKRILTLIIMAGISFTFVFHVVHMVRWMYVYAQGPVEQHMISDLQVYTAEYPENKTLIVQYYIAGAPHTPEAYKDYMDRFGRSEVNLFKVLLRSPLPEGVTPLNAYYIRPDKFVASDMDRFDRVIYLAEPRREINQFDYFDEDLMRLWWYDSLSPQYIILK